MLSFLNMLVCFISIKCYDFFQSSSLFNVVSLISHEVIDLYTLRMYFVDTHTSRNTKCTQWQLQISSTLTIVFEFIEYGSE